MYERYLLNPVTDSVRHSPVTLINGARQTGKSTFIQRFFAPQGHFDYVNLDDLNLLGLAQRDPITFLNQFGDRVAIDEVQRVPNLFLPLKKVVDEHRDSKRFLLSGSANILTLPRLSESLAGRIEVHTLWPLSQGELRGTPDRFIDALFDGNLPSGQNPPNNTELLDMLVKGGYPEAVAQMNSGRGSDWFRSYLLTILQRDVRDLSNIKGLAELPNLLSLLASRAGNLLNVADLARTLRFNSATLKRYYTLLKMLFLVIEIPAWSSNYGKRLSRSPKTFLNDSGLLCHLQGADAASLKRDRGPVGAILENFVVMELLKQTGWNRDQCRLFHFRTATGDEVDVVLERQDGRIAGVEVKASASVSDADFKGLKALAQAAGDRFLRGVVIYTGDRLLKFTETLAAVPVNALWA